MTISETFACLYIAIRTVVYHYTNLVYFEEVISPSQVEYFIKKGLFTTPLKFSMEFLKLYTLLYYEDSYILLHQFDQLCSYILGWNKSNMPHPDVGRHKYYDLLIMQHFVMS
jgi:hypothetical protein